ncbi:MAG: hypothetical protein DMF69_13865 [Acidobacteria bacterium]|nr:MAG: hypothetical protein DMF69_13865 [Acidobacteriota bacterium]
MLRKTLAGVVVLLIGATLMSSRRAEAHNIDLDKAQEVARDFARAIRKESNGNYLHYSTRCGRAFPGHNHIVKCDIEYQNAKDTKAGVYTCKEAIEVYFSHHGRSDTHNYSYFIRHTSGNKCGSRQPGVDYV